MRVEELIIDENLSAMEAMRRLDEVGRRIVFVAPGGVLKAVLTDSDIRKFILRGGDLDRPVSEVANPHPKALPEAKRAEAKDFMRRHVIDALPLLDDAGRITDVVFAHELEGAVAAPPLGMPVVIMAGGLGTRLYPYTKILPKPLIPVGEVPIVERVMHRFAAFGCGEFTMIVNYRKNMIKSYFEDVAHGYSIRYVEETVPLGTGGGLCLLKGQMNNTFFLTNCDILIEADYAHIAEFHKKQGNAVTLVCAMKQFTIPYGVVELLPDGAFAGISEKPHMNYLTNTGLYVVEPRVVEAMADGVPQGFTDIIEQCRARGERVGVYPIGEAGWMDMGQMEELDEMRRRFEQG